MGLSLDSVEPQVPTLGSSLLGSEELSTKDYSWAAEDGTRTCSIVKNKMTLQHFHRDVSEDFITANYQL